MRLPSAFSLLWLSLAGPLCGAADTTVQEATLLFGRGRYAETLERLNADPRVTPSARALLLRGLALRRLNRDAEAVQPLRQAWDRDRGLLDAGVSLGLALQSGGLWAEAEAVFQAAALRHPRSPQPRLGLGQLAASAGRPAGARDHFRAALKLDPRDAAAWAALSDALVKLGDLAEAAEARGKALALNPNDPELLLKQAAARYGLGQDAQAAALLERAASTDKPEAFFLAGCIDHRRGELEQAEKQFLAALRLKPDYAEAQLNLGINDYSRARFSEAIRRFDQIDRRASVYAQAQDYRREASQAAVDQALRQGAEAVIAGEFLAAMAHWDRAEALAQDKAAIRKMLASLRQQQKPRAEDMAQAGHAAFRKRDLAQALVLWNDALTVDPDNRAARDGLKAARKDAAALHRAHLNAARQLAKDGDLKAARAWAQRLGRLDRGAGRVLDQELDLIAQRRQAVLEAAAALALKNGRPDEALRILDQALALAPRDPALLARQRGAEGALRKQVGAWLAKSAVKESGGELQAAYDLLQKALQLEPGNLEAKRNAGRLAARLNLKRMDPGAVERLYYEGVYLYGAGDTHKAVQVWNKALEAAPEHGPLRQALRSAEMKLRTLAQLGER